MRVYKLTDKDGKPVGFKNSLFSYDVGSVFFCKDEQQTPFDKNGVGVSLYFIFVKTLLIFMTIATIASIYLIIVNATCNQKFKIFLAYERSTFAAIKSDQQSIMNSINDFLISTTLAAVSSINYNTVTIPLNGRKNITIECESGTICTNLNFTKFGLVRPGRDKNHILNNFDQECTDWASFYYSIQHCDGNTTCDLEYNESWMKPICQEYENEIGYLRIFCEGSCTNPNQLRSSFIPGDTFEH